MTSSGASGRRRAVSRHTFFHPPYQMLPIMLLGFAVLLCRAVFGATVTSDEEIQDTINSVRLFADYQSPSGFRGKHDVGALAPPARIPWEDAAGSSAMTVDHRHEGVDWTQDAARPPLLVNGSGEDSEAVATSRRATENLGITQSDLKNLRQVVVLQDDGIIYCPIPKVASSEWNRALRWFVGIQNWERGAGVLHRPGQNGLEQLVRRGLEETRWAIESDRYLKFVVVRDPAERMVSAFLNKCVVLGYERGTLTDEGAPFCPYLTIMPELFPDTVQASVASHARLKELVERDPEDTFFHFVSGIWRGAEAGGDACQMPQVHHRPQVCFCELTKILPAFHVMPFSNLSAEAEAFAGRLPAALPDSGSVIVEGYDFGRGKDTMTASGRKTGVNDARRKEIHGFLMKRFTLYHKDAKEATQGITHAVDHKKQFLSERVMRVMHKIAEKDYTMLGEYF